MNILAINLQLSDDLEASRLIDEGRLSIYNAFTLKGVTVLLATYKMDLAIIGCKQKTPEFNKIVKFLNKMYPDLRLIITMWDARGKAVSFLKQDGIPLAVIEQVLPRIISQETEYRTSQNE